MQTKRKDTVANEKLGKAPPPPLHATQSQSSFESAGAHLILGKNSLPFLLAINLTGTSKF